MDLRWELAAMFSETEARAVPARERAEAEAPHRTGLRQDPPRKAEVAERWWEAFTALP